MIDFSCLLAAVCFTAANVMQIIYYIKERNRDHFDWKKYSDLDPSYLQEDWNFRFSKQGLFLSSGFLNAFAWVIFASPLIQLAWCLSRKGKAYLGLNVSIAILAIGGAMVEWLSNLFWIGEYVASKTIVQNFNLDNWLPSVSGDGLGWKTLEVNHVVSSGFVWFTDAFQWLCLTFIYLFTFMSVRRWRANFDRTSFGQRWNGLSLFVSLLAMAEFIAQILRFEGFRTAGQISLIYGALNRIILMPAWILALGVQLPRAQQKLASMSAGAGGAGNDIYASSRDQELALMEMSSAVEDIPNSSTNPFGDGKTTSATNGSNPFSIDDDSGEHSGEPVVSQGSNPQANPLEQ